MLTNYVRNIRVNDNTYRARKSSDRGRHTTGRRQWITSADAAAVEAGQWNHSNVDGEDEPSRIDNKLVTYCTMIGYSR